MNRPGGGLIAGLFGVTGHGLRGQTHFPRGVGNCVGHLANSGGEFVRGAAQVLS